MAITEYLRRGCLALPDEDRAALAGMLLQSLEPGASLDREAVLGGLVSAGVRAFGFDFTAVRTRIQPAPDLRCAAAYIACAILPVSHSDVARWLGVRPCMVTYYRDKMQDAIAAPGSNPRLLRIYQTLMQEYEQARKTDARGNGIPRYD